MFLFFYFFIFIFGLIIGSFLNCLIYRLPRGISLAVNTPPTPSQGGTLTPQTSPHPSPSPHQSAGQASGEGEFNGGLNRSFCPKCKKQICWYDNIPVFSFIFLKGKCRNCGEGISWQYPVVELITAFLFVFVFYNNFQFSIFNFQTIFNFQFLIFNFRNWIIISVMIVIFAIDLKHYLILDIVALPVAGILFIINLFLGFTWQNLLLAGAVGGGFFLIQFLISKGKWIGGGDIRLGFLMGFALGWPNILTALFLAYFIGSFVGVGLILSGKKKWSSQIPMGTFLSVATVIALFWGERILGWYLGLF